VAGTIAITRSRRGLYSAINAAASLQPLEGDPLMFRDIILWLAGVPIFVIILLHLFGVFH
jgi:hypothetical protein